MDAAQRAFWENAARDPRIAARLWVAILTIGGVPAAFEFDLDCAPVRYCTANSYDRHFGKNSPGRVLAYRNFERLAERGIQMLDWSSGDPRYKTQMGALPGPEILEPAVRAQTHPRPPHRTLLEIRRGAPPAREARPSLLRRELEAQVAEVMLLFRSSHCWWPARTDV